MKGVCVFFFSASWRAARAAAALARAAAASPTPRPWVNFRSSFAALAGLGATAKYASNTTKLLVCGWYFVSEKFFARNAKSFSLGRSYARRAGFLFSCRRKWSKSAPPIPRLCALSCT